MYRNADEQTKSKNEKEEDKKTVKQTTNDCGCGCVLEYKRNSDIIRISLPIFISGHLNELHD